MNERILEVPDDSAVALRGVDKVYGDFYALRELTIEFEPGRIHALVGQNGAGKSTCLGLIAGKIKPTAGLTWILGEEYPHGVDARTASTAGVATVYQELSVFPDLSAIENVFIGQLGRWFGTVRWNGLRKRYAQLGHMLGVRIPPDALVGTLSLAEQQAVEIMRGLALDSRVLLLDEPTAVLAPGERESLFRVMRQLRDGGVTIIFVSHYLDEVLAIADTIAVFRDGRLVGKAPVGDYSESSIVEAMLGAEAAELAHAAQVHAAPDVEQREPLLEVRGLSVGKAHDIDLVVRAGEIVGIGGLVGSGRSTVLRALAGAQPARAETFVFDGKAMRPPRSSRAAWKFGIGYIPEDRKASGLVLERSSKDNIALGDFARVSRFGVISGQRLNSVAHKLAATFGLAPRLVDLLSGRLSGGNQQKVLFARWALRMPRLLLADESTRGVDVGSKGQIMQTLRSLADDGMGIIFVSSDLKEVAAVSDRIYVFRSGAVAGEISDTAGVTQDDILSLAFGVAGRA